MVAGGVGGGDDVPVLGVDGLAVAADVGTVLDVRIADRAGRADVVDLVGAVGEHDQDVVDVRQEITGFRQVPPVARPVAPAPVHAQDLPGDVGDRLVEPAVAARVVGGRAERGAVLRPVALRDVGDAVERDVDGGGDLVDVHPGVDVRAAGVAGREARIVGGGVVRREARTGVAAVGRVAGVVLGRRAGARGAGEVLTDALYGIVGGVAGVGGGTLEAAADEEEKDGEGDTHRVDLGEERVVLPGWLDHGDPEGSGLLKENIFPVKSLDPSSITNKPS